MDISKRLPSIVKTKCDMLLFYYFLLYPLRQHLSLLPLIVSEWNMDYVHGLTNSCAFVFQTKMIKTRRRWGNFRRL